MNKKEIQALVVKRMDVKHELELAAVEIKGIVDKSGLLSNSEKQQLSSSLSGMGAMMAIPEFIGKLAPLKGAIAPLKKAFELLLEINEINEQIQDCMVCDLYELYALVQEAA